MPPPNLVAWRERNPGHCHRCGLPDAVCFHTPEFLRDVPVDDLRRHNEACRDAYFRALDRLGQDAARQLPRPAYSRYVDWYHEWVDRRLRNGEYQAAAESRPPDWIENEPPPNANGDIFQVEYMGEFRTAGIDEAVRRRRELGIFSPPARIPGAPEEYGSRAQEYADRAARTADVMFDLGGVTTRRESGSMGWRVIKNRTPPPKVVGPTVWEILMEDDEE